jgi:hypothetical protein
LSFPGIEDQELHYSGTLSHLRKEIMGLNDLSATIWRPKLTALLPLWLFSLAVMSEGFPHPPIPGWLAMIAFGLAIFSSVLFLWKRWITIELLVYCLIPLSFLPVFDEISTAYKTPFIVACTLLLSTGLIISQFRSTSRLQGGLLLLSLAVFTFFLAWSISFNYWDMTSDLGYFQCFPDAYGCPPLTGGETPWWDLVIKL